MEAHDVVSVCRVCNSAGAHLSEGPDSGWDMSNDASAKFCTLAAESERRSPPDVLDDRFVPSCDHNPVNRYLDTDHA